MYALATFKPPGLCEVCRRWSRGAFCSDCLARHAAPALRCDGCALRLPAGAARCGECLREPAPFERCRCAADYGFPWSGLIGAFKFRERVELAAPLAALLSGSLGDMAAWPELVTAVPLSRARLRERGYNQAWELARRVAAQIARPAHAGLLRRAADGPHQVALRRDERQRQLRGAFRAAAPGRIEGRRVALVDDVLTTGATAAEATRALLGAGAAAVQVWAVARTPAP